MRVIIAAFLVLSAGLLSGWAPQLAGNGAVDTAHQCLRSNLPVTNYQCLTYPDPVCKTYTKPTDPNPTTLSTPEYQVAGHTWYVAPTGSDTTGDGSIGNPWATPHQVGVKIGTTIADGDTVLFRGGAYNLINTGAFSTNHTATKWITLAAYPGETPVFTLANASNISLFLFQNNVGGAKMYRLSGLTLRATASQTTNRPLVNVQGTPNSDIILDHNDIANADNVTSWTWQDWQTNSPGNIINAIPVTSAQCLWLAANHIHNTTTLGLIGQYEGLAANELDHMTGDIVDFKCNHCKDINNFKHDPVLAVNPATPAANWGHGDYLQIQSGGPYVDIQFSGNTEIDWYAGDNTFPTSDQPFILASGVTYLTITDNYMSGGAYNSINSGGSYIFIAGNTCIWNGTSMISFSNTAMQLYTPPAAGTDDYFIVVNNLCNANVSSQQVKALAHGVYQNNDFLNSYVDATNTRHSTVGTYEGNKVLAAANSAILSNWSNAGTNLQLYYIVPHAAGANWTVGDTMNVNIAGENASGTVTAVSGGGVTAVQVTSSGAIPVASLPLNQYYSIPGTGTSVTSCAIGGGCTGFSASLYYGFTLGTTFPQDPTLASAVTPIGDGVTQAALNTLTSGWGFQPTLPSYNINGALFASPPNVGAY